MITNSLIYNLLLNAHPFLSMMVYAQQKIQINSHDVWDNWEVGTVENE